MHTLTLDNSSFGTLYCPRRFQLSIIEGLRGATNQNSAFGSAFHKGAEVLDKTNDVNAAMSAVLDMGLKIDELKLIETLTALKLTNRLPPPLTMANGQPGIEVKFKYRAGTVPTSYGFLDIHLAGTIDRIHITDDNYLEFVDYKTAMDFKPASQATKMEEYENSFQLPFYKYSAVQADILPPEALQLITDGRWRMKHIFAFYTSSPVRIAKRDYSPLSNEFYDTRFKTTLDYYIIQAVSIWEQTKRNQIAAYGGMNTYKGCTYCPFRPGCTMFDNQREAEFLTRFEKIPYDPLTFR